MNMCVWKIFTYLKNLGNFNREERMPYPASPAGAHMPSLNVESECRSGLGLNGIFDFII